MIATLGLLMFVTLCFSLGYAAARLTPSQALRLARARLREEQQTTAHLRERLWIATSGEARLHSLLDMKDETIRALKAALPPDAP